MIVSGPPEPDDPCQQKQRISAVAQHRHKRDTNARAVPRAALVAAPIAVLATVSAVAVGVLSQDPTPAQDLRADTSLSERATASRGPVVSRSQRREVAGASASVADAAQKAAAAKKAKKLAKQRKAAAATAAAVKAADTKMWATADLNLWDDSDEKAEKVGLLEEGDKVRVTGRTRDGRVEVVVDGKSRWVTAGYLTDEKPAAGVGGSCTNGTSVPSGVSASIAKVHRAVCARWPQVSSYGTFRGDGEHSQGRAVDIMVSGSTGWEIAEYLRENAGALGIEYLIYSQKIWSVERGGEGWRGMSNRGSATANHYDHVHVTVW